MEISSVTSRDMKRGTGNRRGMFTVCCSRITWGMKRGRPAYYQPQRSWGQGNIFAPVCHSVQRGGLPQCMLGYPPGPDPPLAHPLPSGTPPPSSREQAPPGGVNERPVRVLLECILVSMQKIIISSVKSSIRTTTRLHLCARSKKFPTAFWAFFGTDYALCEQAADATK